MKNRVTLVFLFAFAVGAFFRFYRLTEVPASLSHDEVAIGYNAYSILKTGRDEYGSPFPILFRSFDDYKLPGLVYAMVPSVAIFGLTELGVRFPIAFLGSVTVPVVFLIAREFERRRVVPRHTPGVAALLIAIQPWHVNFSRQAFESTGSLFFYLTGLYFLIRSVPDRPNERVSKIPLMAAAALFAISLYFYYHVRLIIPPVLVAYLFVNRRRILTNLRILLGSAVIGTVLVLPLIPAVFSGGGLARVGIVSVTNDRHYLERSGRYATELVTDVNPATKAVYNFRVALLETAFENYLKNLAPDYLFINGLNETGLLYVWELPFVATGIILLVTRLHPLGMILITYLLATPLVGAFSVDQPNALRTLPNAPVLAILTATGLTLVLTSIRKRYRIPAAIAVLGVASFSAIRLSYLYFQMAPHTRSRDFGDGHKQMVRYVQEHRDAYDEILISGEYWRPYIFYLFWTGYDPALYQKSGSKDQIENILFAKSIWDKDGNRYMGNNSFDPHRQAWNPDQKQLFILAEQDYNVHKERFVVLAPIHGVHTVSPFFAAVINTDYNLED